MLAALEDVVMNSSSASTIRWFARSLLLNMWTTLPFNGHRVINPSEVIVTSSQLAVIPTLSGTTGPDQAVRSRPFFVDACCCMHHTTWMQIGWCILQSLAGNERYHLMLAPSSSLTGFTRTELRNDTAVLRVPHSRDNRSSRT